MTNCLNICVIGGSNSLMGRGYVPPMVAMAQTMLGRRVNLNNVSIGGTFSHFGLWQLLSKKPHLDADVIVVEYVLNDSELTSFGMMRHWAKAYEGLIWKLRQEAPGAQIICPLLINRSMAATPNLFPLVAGVMMINARYDVATIDVNKEITAKAPAPYWDAASDWYVDGSHYAKPYQVMIGEMIVSAIRDGAGRRLHSYVPPVSGDHFGQARSAVAEGIFAALMPEGTEVVSYQNRLVHEMAHLITPGRGLNLHLKGEIVALIMVSTRADGVLAYHHGDAVTHAGLYRKAFSEPKFDFLMNVFVPDQYFRNTPRPAVASTPGQIPEQTPIRIEVLDTAAIAALPKKSIVSRPTATLPETKGQSLAFALVDILYVGELSKAEWLGS